MHVDLSETVIYNKKNLIKTIFFTKKKISYKIFQYGVFHLGNRAAQVMPSSSSSSVHTNIHVGVPLHFGTGHVCLLKNLAI